MNADTVARATVYPYVIAAGKDQLNAFVDSDSRKCIVAGGRCGRVDSGRSFSIVHRRLVCDSEEQ